MKGLGVVLLGLWLWMAVVQPAASAQSFSDVRGIQGRGLENLLAFTRLLGYVRYFHPSDAAYTADWESFAVAHIEGVEKAASPEELAARLSQLFVPYAPTLQVFPSGKVPSLMPDLNMPLGVEPLFVTVQVRTVLGESDTLLLHRGDRVSIPVINRQLPTQFEYRGIGPVRFPELKTLPLNDPSKPYRVELGGGVSAAIPLAVFSNNTATLPRTPIPRPAPLQPDFSTANPASVRNRANRLAVVAVAWNVFQHLFAYWDLVNTDWLRALQTALQEAATAPDEPSFVLVLQRLTAGLQDGHHFLDRTGRSAYGSHTVPFTMDLIEGKLVVTTLTGDAGDLKVGDVIERLNGRAALEALAQTEERISGSAAYRRYLALALLMGGGVGSSMELEVNRGTVVLKRSISRSVQKRRSLPSHLREPRPPLVAQLAPGIMYADLSRIEEGKAEVLVRALEGAKGIVFDMRGYANGVALKLLSHLSDKPLNSPQFQIPILTRPDHQNIQYVTLSNVWAEPKQPRLTSNVAFIINSNGTISYPESILSMVEGYGLGKLVGQPTAGTNGNVVNLILPGRYLTRWTGLRSVKPNGSVLFLTGVQPTLVVERTLAGVVKGCDELLEAAFLAVAGVPINRALIEEYKLP